MGISLAYSNLTLEELTCSECGIAYAIPDNRIKSLRENHKCFYCPNGHQQYFVSETVEERLRKELNKEKERTRWAEEENKKVTAKLKKTEKRISNGVCPCCNRTFTNLQRHMSCKHKEYVR